MKTTIKQGKTEKTGKEEKRRAILHDEELQVQAICLGASLLDEEGSPLPKQGVVHKLK